MANNASITTKFTRIYNTQFHYYPSLGPITINFFIFIFLMAHVRGSWQIECNCKIVVNFVVTLVLVMPPSSLSHKLANKKKEW